MSDALTLDTIRYASSIDGLAPLYADVCFVPDGRPKPVTAVLHGFHCTRGHVRTDLEILARRGLFCVAPDMRGHGDSAGKHDCGALQICDLVDSLREAARAHPAEADPRRVSAVGYSGGGANVLSLATKFPELLQAGAAFFGISDYESWYRSSGRPDCNQTMERAVGGSPDDVPTRYLARSSLRAARNNPHTRLHLLWDAEEKDCPPFQNEWYADAARRAGHTNVRTHVSVPGDAARWIHAYRSVRPELTQADDLFLPDILAAADGWQLPAQGVLDVCGYVVTRRFAVWLGDGTAGWARVRYDATGPTPRVECVDQAGAPGLRVVAGATLLAWQSQM